MGERYLGEDGTTVYILDDQSAGASLAENRAVFQRAFLRTVEALKLLGKEIIIINQIPETEFDVPQAVARKVMLGRNTELRPRMSDYQERNAFVTGVFESARQRFGLVTVSPHASMCIAGKCEVTSDGVPVYWDSSHLTATYAETLADIFDPVWAKDD